METIETEINKLQSLDWKYEKSLQPSVLPEVVANRYSWISPDAIELIAEINTLVRSDEKMWILTGKDFRSESKSSFSWNEFEIQSLQAAGKDQSQIDAVTLFWDKHFPIAICVEDGYVYYALCENGTVVTGRGPEFEQTTIFADNYLDFLKKIIV
jgi:hypothetical protein